MAMTFLQHRFVFVGKFFNLLQKQESHHCWTLANKPFFPRNCSIGIRHFVSQNPNSTQIERTVLYNFHCQHGGKMVNFGGYALPLQYADQGIVASHLHTRRCGSIFDVSHMLQTYVSGKDAIECMESICTADIRNTVSGSGALTVFTNDVGGILDDLIVTKVSDRLLYVVSNAAMKAQDMEIMSTAMFKYKSEGKDVNVLFMPSTEQSLIAVQGPQACATLSTLLPNAINLRQLYFMQTLMAEIAGVSNCRITRCGYTGEDGVEISVPSLYVQHVVEALLNVSGNSLKLGGLGVRDSLRLEAGLCLYGSDIDAQTTPIEAGLSWLVAKRRRSELNFPGSKNICKQLKEKVVSRRRIGIIGTAANMPPARAGVQIYHNERVVGHITSGCPSPSLGKNIAMGYIDETLKSPRAVQLKIRDKFYNAEISKMPFVKTKYFMLPKNV